MDDHSHDDCAQCLQKKVRRLEAELNEWKERALEDKTPTNQEKHTCKIACAECGNKISGYVCEECRTEKEKGPCVNCGYYLERHAHALLKCPVYFDDAKSFTR